MTTESSHSVDQRVTAPGTPPPIASPTTEDTVGAHAASRESPSAAMAGLGARRKPRACRTTPGRSQRVRSIQRPTNPHACLTDLEAVLDAHVRQFVTPTLGHGSRLHVGIHYSAAGAPPLPCPTAESARLCRNRLSRQCRACLEAARRQIADQPGRACHWVGACGFAHLRVGDQADGCWSLALTVRAPVHTSEAEPGGSTSLPTAPSDALGVTCPDFDPGGRQSGAAARAGTLAEVRHPDSCRLRFTLDVECPRSLSQDEFDRTAALAALILDDLRQTGLNHCARWQGAVPALDCRPAPQAYGHQAPKAGTPRALPGHPGHPHTPRHARELVRFALNTAVADLAHPLALKELAERLHLNAAYLSALITQTTGSPFRDHLREVRLVRAKALLADPRLHIADIALALGFGDANCFRLAFKHWTGQSPCAWRETH